MITRNNNVKISVPVYGSLFILFAVIAVFYSFYGRIFLDAGFYLNAAREVYRGQLPYRDFFFVQGPVYPYVYGLPLSITGFHLLYARWLSILFGLSAIGLSAWTANRIGGKTGALIALVSLATVPSQAYFFASVKLYALSAVLLMAAFTLLSSRRSPDIRYSGGLILAILAAATRLTLLPVVPIVAVYIVIDSYRVRQRFPWSALLAGAATASAIAFPFLLADPEAVWYYLIGIHTSATEGPYRFAMTKQLKVVVKILLYYPIFTLSIMYVLRKIVRKTHFADLKPLEWTMAISICAVTAAHLTANWFSVGYQSVLMPLSAAFLGGLSGRWLGWDRIPRKWVAAGFILILVSGTLTWKQHVWMTSLTVTRNLQFISEVIAHKSPDGGLVAGCSAVFALEADRPIAGAFGGAPFTYTPAWTDEQCHRFGGMNNRILIDMISAKIPAVLLLESNSFTVGSPGFFPVSEEKQAEIFTTIDTYYVKTATLRNLGNGQPDLIMYIPAAQGSAQ